MDLYNFSKLALDCITGFTFGGVSAGGAASYGDDDDDDDEDEDNDEDNEEEEEDRADGISNDLSNINIGTMYASGQATYETNYDDQS